jgi:hypothetical protein
MPKVARFGIMAVLIVGLAYLAAREQLVLMFILALVTLSWAVLMCRKRIGRNFRSYRSNSRESVSWILAAFPLVVSVRQSSIVTIGLLVALCLVLLLTRGVAQQANRLPLYLLAGSGALVLGVNLNPTLVVFSLAAAFLWLAARRYKVGTAFASLRAGLVIYLVANILGHYAGLPSPLDSSRLGGYETSSALFAERVAFPFARSINEPSTVAAVFLGLVVAGFMLSRRTSLLDWVGLAAGAYVVLASNSRTPLIVAAVIGFITLMAPLIMRRFGPAFSFALAFTPFLLSIYMPLINWAAEIATNITYLARGQSAEQIAGLGTRAQIWEGLLGFWADHPDGRHAWIGYGQNGHATSGANATYLDTLGGFLADKTGLSSHNSFLQQLFDGGYIGVALLLAGVVIIAYRLSRTYLLLPQLVAVCTLIVASAGESFLAPGLTTTPFFLLLYIAAFAPSAAWARRGEKRPKLSLPRTDSADANLR